MKHIYLDSDFDLVSWVIEHKDEIARYRPWDYGATIFELENGDIYCLYT